MHQTISILDRKWIRGPKKLKALKITLFFNNQKLVLKISARSQIKELARIYFYTFSRRTRYKLKKDLASELRFNQKQCKRTLKNNQKAKKMIMNSTYLLH